MPMIFGAIVAASGSYPVGFGVLTALSLLAVALLVVSGRKKSRYQ